MKDLKTEYFLGTKILSDACIVFSLKNHVLFE